MWKPERHGPLRRPRRIPEDNIKRNTTETGEDGVDWLDLDHDEDR